MNRPSLVIVQVAKLVKDVKEQRKVKVSECQKWKKEQDITSVVMDEYTDQTDKNRR